MDRSRYLEMCERFGDEPEEDKMPPTYSDFPYYVHLAFDIYNILPDNFTGGMSSIFCGKDYSALTIAFEMYQVPTEERLDVFKIILHLDTRARKHAMREAEKASKK